MKHPTEVEKYSGTLEELAVDVCNLRYDRLSDFLRYCSNEIASQAGADSGRGRLKLALSLSYLARGLNRAKTLTDKVWKICGPYMKDLPSE
ncbi:MAG: hypothetical protein ABIF40_00315 [archaeon]